MVLQPLGILPVEVLPVEIMVVAPHGSTTPWWREPLAVQPPVAPPLAAPSPQWEYPWWHHPPSLVAPTLAAPPSGSVTLWRRDPVSPSPSQYLPAPSATWHHLALPGTTRHYLSPSGGTWQQPPEASPPEPPHSCHGGGSATYLEPAPADPEKVNVGFTMFSKPPLKFALSIITPLCFWLLV